MIIIGYGRAPAASGGGDLGTITPVGTPSQTTYTSRTNTTVATVAGIEDDDGLLFTVFTLAATEAPDPTPPAGFDAPVALIDVSSAGGVNAEFRVYLKRANSESGDYTFTHSTASSQATLSVWRGIDWSQPLDIAAETNSGRPGDSIRTFPSVTTVTENALLIGAGFDWADNSAALSPPAGMTELIEINPLTYVCYQQIAAPGATGDKTHVCNANPFEARGGVSIALRPAPAAGGGGTITEVGTPVATSVATGTVGTTTTVSLMTGLAEGDVVVGFLSVDDNPLQFGSGNGGGFDFGTGSWTELIAPAGTVYRIHAVYKRMGSTPDSTISIWRAGTRQQAVLLRAFRGVHATALDGAVQHAYTGVTTDPIDPPSLTTSYANSLRIIFGGMTNTNETGRAAPSGFGSLVEAATAATGSNGSSLVTATRVEATPGALDPDAFTGVTTTGYSAALHFALRPA